MNVHLKALGFFALALGVIGLAIFAGLLWSGHSKRAAWASHVAQACPDMRKAVAKGTAGERLSTFQYYISECDRLGV